MQRSLFVSFAALLLSGCPDIVVDPDETNTAARVEFDPAKSIVPFPNDLARSPDGTKVALPPQLCESPTSKAVREGVINKLDGFGTYQAAMQVTLTAAVDIASAAENVKLYKKDGDTLTAIPAITMPSVSVRYADANSCASPTIVNSLVVVSPTPLAQRTTYVVAVLDGLKVMGSQDTFTPDGTWLIARSEKPPVVFEGDVITENNTPLEPTEANIPQLKQIEFLWKAHVELMTGLVKVGLVREKILVAWRFTTATVQDPIDPSVTDSVASKVSAAPFAGMAFPAGVPGAGFGEQFLIGALGAPTCSAIHCENVADVFGGAFQSQQFQTTLPNAAVPAKPMRGPWSDPVNPATPTDPASLELIRAIIITPKTTMPAAGWPIVIYGHGLGSKKETAVAIGPQLAGQGFATVAIDHVLHGERSIQIKTDGNCAGTPDPTVTANANCFQQFLSTDLAGTRDNFRQQVLDLQRFTKALLNCSNGTTCGGVATLPAGVQFKVDPTKIFYVGISLGGIIGSTFTAVSPTVKASVLNVPAVGLIDVLENTLTVEIRCTLVNGLIAAGILQGTVWNPASPTAGLCVEANQGWKTQPGYLQFATIGRWVLDPADGANFTPKLAAKRILIQEVVGDEVVPNVATEREGMLVGLTPANGDPALPPQVVPVTPPSAALTPGASHWLKYPEVPADAGTGFPGNVFEHPSLLRPSMRGAAGAGSLGTLRLQTDAITFLLQNLN